VRSSDPALNDRVEAGVRPAPADSQSGRLAASCVPDVAPICATPATRASSRVRRKLAVVSDAPARASSSGYRSREQASAPHSCSRQPPETTLRSTTRAAGRRSASARASATGVGSTTGRACAMRDSARQQILLGNPRVAPRDISGPRYTEAPNMGTPESPAQGLKSSPTPGASALLGPGSEISAGVPPGYQGPRCRRPRSSPSRRLAACRASADTRRRRRRVATCATRRSGWELILSFRVAPYSGVVAGGISRGRGG
jgi:hypothetical protein